MTARTDLAYGFTPQLSLREIAHWATAALVVLAAHGLLVYAFQNLRGEPAAEGMDSALMIELAPLAVSTPEAVEQEVFSEQVPTETLTPVEPTETVAETLEPVEPVRPEDPIAPVANEVPEPVEETEQAEAVTPEEVVPEEVTPEVVEPEQEAPEMANVVLPQTDIPLPTPRPEPPKPPREEPRQERPRKAETQVKRTEKPARTKTRRSAPPASSSRASAPRVSPAKWQSRVVAWLNRHKRYPRAARSRGEEGTAQVSFTINASGTVTGARIARSSGNAALDQAAVDMVRRASPVPAPPPQIARASMSLSVPVSFNLK